MAKCQKPYVLGILILIFVVQKISCEGPFDLLLGDPEPCSDVCDKTYTQHTYDKPLHKSYCQRGCRLFSIIDFAQNGVTNANETRKDCINSCKESLMQKEDLDACSLGCSSQVSLSLRKRAMREETKPSIHLLYPLMYVHRIYTNMMNDISNQVSVTWSYYIQADDGRLIVMSSQPKVYTGLKSMSDIEEKTTNMMESSIFSSNNAATPNLKSVQIKPDLNLAVEQNGDWLDCISKKTGLPRLFLTFTICMSAFVMIWLSFTITATAPEHKLMPQKLSIYGDLEYLKEIKDTSLIWKVHPQECGDAEASPLPVKIQIEKV